MLLLGHELPSRISYSDPTTRYRSYRLSAKFDGQIGCAGSVMMRLKTYADYLLVYLNTDHMPAKAAALA